MKYYLAIDGGGTKTHALCADETGKVLGEGFSGPTSLTAISIGAAGFNLKEAIRQSAEALPVDTQFESLVMGLAGMDTPQEENTARHIFSQVLSDRVINRFTLVNDSLIALESGTDAANALVLISGTGSNCIGRNQEGITAHAGGMDYVLTDQGSGYSIGRAVLRKAVKSYDGRGQKTMLEQFLCEHFRIVSLSELKIKVHNPPLNKTEVAELSQLCLRAFDQGDQVAKDIFEQNVDELVIMVKAVLSRLHLTDAEATCVIEGSITKIGYVQQILHEKLKQLFPKLEIVVPHQAPVYGALKMALRPNSV